MLTIKVKTVTVYILTTCSITSDVLKRHYFTMQIVYNI